MKTYTMTAEAAPKNFDSWFNGFQEDLEFQAESLEEACEFLNDECAKAGTNEDPHYDQFGPTAKENSMVDCLLAHNKL